MRYYDADQAVARIRLATTEKGYTLPNGTQVPDRTDWHTVLLWKGLAKIAERYVHKGDKICVEGRIRYRSEDTQKGERRYVTEIYADSMELLTPRSARRDEAQQAASGGQTQASGGQAQTAGGSSKLPF